MGYFSVCLERDIDKLLQNIKENASLMVGHPNCDYLLNFIESDVKTIREILALEIRKSLEGNHA